MSDLSVFNKYSSSIIFLLMLILIPNNVRASLGTREISLQPFNLVDADNGIKMKTTYDVNNEPIYFGGENNYLPLYYYDDDINNQKRSSRIHVFRRGCIHRNGACDNRLNDCCFNSACRCNLWGGNCRCQRMGLFQKLG